MTKHIIYIPNNFRELSSTKKTNFRFVYIYFRDKWLSLDEKEKEKYRKAKMKWYHKRIVYAIDFPSDKRFKRFIYKGLEELTERNDPILETFFEKKVDKIYTYKYKTVYHTKSLIENKPTYYRIHRFEQVKDKLENNLIFNIFFEEDGKILIPAGISVGEFIIKKLREIARKFPAEYLTQQLDEFLGILL